MREGPREPESQRIPKTAADFQNRRPSAIFEPCESKQPVRCWGAVSAMKPGVATSLRSASASIEAERQARRLRELVAELGWNAGVRAYKRELLEAADREESAKEHGA